MNQISSQKVFVAPYETLLRWLLHIGFCVIAILCAINNRKFHMYIHILTL